MTKRKRKYIPVVIDKETLTKKEYEKEKNNILYHYKTKSYGIYVKNENGCIYIYYLYSNNLYRNIQTIKSLIKNKESRKHIYGDMSDIVYNNYFLYGKELIMTKKFDELFDIMKCQYLFVHKHMKDINPILIIQVYYNMVRALGNLNRFEDIYAFSNETLEVMKGIQTPLEHLPLLYYIISNIKCLFEKKEVGINLLKEGFMHEQKCSIEHSKNLEDIFPLTHQSYEKKELFEIIKTENEKLIQRFDKIIECMERSDYNVYKILQTRFSFSSYYSIYMNNKDEFNKLSYITQSFLYEAAFREYFDNQDFVKSYDYGKKCITILIKTGAYGKKIRLIWKILRLSNIIKKYCESDSDLSFDEIIFQYHDSTLSILYCNCGIIFPRNTCNGCNIKRYCSKKCQKSDWNNHKIYCKLTLI